MGGPAVTAERLASNKWREKDAARNRGASQPNVRLVLFMRTLLWIVLIVGTAVAHAGEVEVRVSAEPANFAWWLRIAFAPTHTQIRGVPVSEINKFWRRASELKREYLPKELRYENGADIMDQSELAFSVVGDFKS